MRRGSETVKASNEVFQRLIDYRSGKVREIAKWVDKSIIVQGRGSQAPQGLQGIHDFRLLSVNGFYVTLKSDQGKQISVPLDDITINWHHQKDCLQLNAVFLYYR